MNIPHRTLSIISFPSNLGLIEPAPGKEPGVNKLPEWLKKFGFFDLFKAQEEIRLNPPPYSMELEPISNMRNTHSIAAYARQQASIIREVISKKNFALVIGGDCSILIGNALGLKQTGHNKLFFIDGHTDFMWPSLSSTHGVAGMDLAIVTGNGHEYLANIDGQKPYFSERDVWCVGNREYDADYVAAISKTGIHYYDLNTLRTSGIIICLDAFFKDLLSEPTDGFWIHLDVDALDPLIMPAVDSPDAGGLTYPELTMLIGPLISNPQCRGLEITIFDPDRDPDGKYVREFITEVGTTIQKSLTVSLPLR